jgi:hypothetical protein
VNSRFHNFAYHWVGWKSWRKAMGRILALGTVGMFLALGTLAARADNPNVPGFSPYAIMAYNPNTTSALPSVVPVRIEHRAAATEAAPTFPNSNVPSFSPYVLVPQGH